MALKSNTECKKCFQKGFQKFVAMAGLSQTEYNHCISLVEKALDAEFPPPLAGQEAWAFLKKNSKVGPDIFADEKKFFTLELLKHYNFLKENFLLKNSSDKEALAATTWSNLIDVGQGKPLPKIEDLLNLFSAPLLKDERSIFLNILKSASTLLVIGDNAGETVLDKLFLDLTNFSGKIYYMTRDSAVMNDATNSDARLAGLHKVSQLVSSGSDIPGFIPSYISDKAKAIFYSADIILAKGQGNLEGLLGRNDCRIFHSFVVKCEVVADALNIPVGSGVFSRFLNAKGNNYANL